MNGLHRCAFNKYQTNPLGGDSESRSEREAGKQSKRENSPLYKVA